MAFLELVLFFGGKCSYGDLCCSGFLIIAIYVVSNNVIYTNA